MIEIKSAGVIISLCPDHDLVRDIRNLVYSRTPFAELEEEEVIGLIIEWMIMHGNRCFQLGQQFGE